jgi:hypothetical protein
LIEKKVKNGAKIDEKKWQKMARKLIKKSKKWNQN